MPLFLATRERVCFIKDCHLSVYFVFFQLTLDVFFYFLCILSRCINIVSSTLKFAISIFEFHVSILLVYHQTTLPFEIPHEPRNAHFGWDLEKHMYMVWAYFCFNQIDALPFTEFLRICPISSLLIPYIAFLRYLGANTT